MILKSIAYSLTMQFFAGVVFFAVVVGFIPEPTLAPSSDVKNKKVRMIYSPNKGTFTNYACICISTLGTSIIWAEYLKVSWNGAWCWRTEKWGWRATGHYEKTSAPSFIQWNYHSSRYVYLANLLQSSPGLLFELLQIYVSSFMEMIGNYSWLINCIFYRFLARHNCLFDWYGCC